MAKTFNHIHIKTQKYKQMSQNKTVIKKNSKQLLDFVSFKLSLNY